MVYNHFSHTFNAPMHRSQHNINTYVCIVPTLVLEVLYIIYPNTAKSCQYLSLHGFFPNCLCIYACDIVLYLSG